MLELLKGPQWLARSLCQLRALQKPIRRSPTLSLKHCTVRCLPMTSLPSDLRAIQPREPDDVVVVFFLVTAANRSFNDTHALHTSYTHLIPNAVRRMLRIGSRILKAGSVASNLAANAPESSRNGRGGGPVDIELIKSTSCSMCKSKTD